MNIALEDLFTYENLYSSFLTVVVLVTIYVIERVIKKAIKGVVASSEIEKHIENMFLFVTKIILYFIGIAFVLGIWGLPTEWFISVSALSGAAIGFASTQTIGNLLAGLYIMVSRPFLVRDYVRIGNAEGEIQKITLNYVKIYTPTYTIIEIPNKVVLDSTIHLFMNNGIIDYSFSMSFAAKIWAAAWMSLLELNENILDPAIEEFWEKYKNELPKKPEMSVLSIGHMERKIMMRAFFPRGKAKLLYAAKPELQKMILNRLDEYRLKRDKETG